MGKSHYSSYAPKYMQPTSHSRSNADIDFGQPIYSTQPQTKGQCCKHETR